MEAFTSYTLQQPSPNTQSLTPVNCLNPSILNYDIELAPSGIMSRKPGIVITKISHSTQSLCAEVRFTSFSSNNVSINYAPTSGTQVLSLKSWVSQKYKCTGPGQRTMWWQPISADQDLLQLTDDATTEVFAIFKYKDIFALWRRLSKRDRNVHDSQGAEEVGELRVGAHVSAEMVDMVVCSALAVLERKRRRIQGQSAFRQGSCAVFGMTTVGGV